VVLAESSTGVFNPAGTWLYAEVAPYTGEFVNVGTAAATSFDTDVVWPTWNPTGSVLAYALWSGEVKSASIATGSVTSLLAATGKAQWPLAISPDGARVLYATRALAVDAGASEYGYGGLGITGSVAPTPLFADRVLQDPSWSTFTADSSYVVLDSVGTLVASPVAGGPSIELTAAREGSETLVSGDTLLYLTGSSSILRVVDVASPSSQTVIDPPCSGNYALTADGKTVVFGSGTGGAVPNQLVAAKL
jgi:hypothetical protein